MINIVILKNITDDLVLKKPWHLYLKNTYFNLKITEYIAHIDITDILQKL